MNLATFRVRIMGSALLTALLALLAVWLTIALTLGIGSPRPNLEVPAAIRAACNADPAAFGRLRIGASRLTTYDERGRPSDEAAPPLDLAALSAVGIGEAVEVEATFARWHVVTRVAAQGPCTWMMIDEGPPPSILTGLQVGLGLGTALAVLLVAVATYGLTVAPLLRRIERLRDAAVAVGLGEYLSSGDETQDALAQIGIGLDRSHARIEADRQELTARHQALERYLAEIAHDLRTPIGSLLLAVQEVHAETPSDCARRAILDTAYLSALVENLHQAARLQHGLDPAEASTDLRELLLRLEVRFRALGALEGIAVAVAVPDEPVMVQCTPVLAERAIANLLHNSLAHGATQVAARLQRRKRAFVLLVLDDGPGVALPASLALRTFTDSKDRPRGPGLGLAITNEIALRSGWSIRYRSGEEGGLTVEIEGELGCADSISTSA